MTSKNPEIRFKGFTEAWEQRKLGELSADFEYGLNASAASYDGTNKYIRITDISEGDRLFIQDNITSPSIDISEADKYLLKKGDILFARTGASVGKSYRYQESDGKVYYAGFLIRARIDTSYDVEFAFQNTLTNNYKRFVEITSQRSGQPGINAKEYADFKLQVPKLQEQKVIGEFFKLLDNTIALHQHELTLLKQRKKAFLQNMFPKQGESVPEIRFCGFTEAWEQRKLGEVFNQTVDYVDPKEVNLELWSVTVENGLTPKTERYNREALVKKKDKFKAVHPGEIVYNPMNMTIGSVGFNNSDKSVAVSGYYVTMNMNEGFSNSYFSTWLPSIKAIQIYKNYATGSLIEKQRVQFPTLSTIKVQIPSFEEQEKIGIFFKLLDNTIALHQRKLDTLKKLKQSFLQKMFV